MDQKKRDCIILSAAKAFARFGFKKASVDEIARDAGVAKGTVYLAAESKEELLYQALLHDVREWNAQMAKMIDPSADPMEMFAALALAGVESIQERPLLKQLFEGDLHALLPSWRDRFDEVTRLGRRNTEEVLQIGIRQGKFRPELDVEETAVLLMDLQVSTILFHQRETPDKDARMGRRLAAAMALISHGLFAAQPAVPAPAPERARRSSTRS